MNKLETLQAIFDGAELSMIRADRYNMKLSDGIDESGTGGAWDMAGHAAMEILGDLYNIDDDKLSDRTLGNIKDRLQELLYNFITEFKE